MISYEQFSQIRHLRDNVGLNASQIANTMELDERTIQKWIEIRNYIPRTPVAHASKLDPFKKQIQEMLEKYPYSGAQILLKLKEQGYTGGRSILSQYIFKIRPPHREGFLTLHFDPGECAQVDWGYAGLVKVGEHLRKMYVFVMVLCYSRMLYVEFTLSQQMEFFLSCHQNAFRFFGGTPAKIMIDNLKTGVLRHRFGEAPVFNPQYLDFAQHHGFRIIACNVGKGNEKGRVENGVRYVKCNFLNGHEFTDFKFIHTPAQQWRDEVANVRIHGETHKRPADLFAEEKKHLQKLHLNLFDVGQMSSVRANHQFRVTCDSNRYSVPSIYASSLLQMKVYPHEILFYKGNELIAQHVRSFEKRKDIEKPEHSIALLQKKKKAKDQKAFQIFLSLTPEAETYYRLLEEKRFNAQTHIRKIAALSEIYGKEATGAAIRSALELQAISSEYIENLLEQQKRLLELKPDVTLQVAHGKEMLEIELPAPDMEDYNHE